MWDVLQAAAQGALPFARLVGDDRVHVEAHTGRLLVRPAAALAGLLEIRGLGIRRLPYEPVAVVGLVVDLAAADAARLPEAGGQRPSLQGFRLPRLAVAAGMPALPMVLAYLKSSPAGIDLRPAFGLTRGSRWRLKKLTITGLGSRPPKTDTSEPPLAPAFPQCSRAPI